MQPDNYRQQKALAIARNTIHCAQTLQQLAPIAFAHKQPRILKRIPMRAHAYRRNQKAKQKFAQVQLAISMAMGAIQNSIILSQPTPRFKNAKSQEINNADYTSCK